MRNIIRLVQVHEGSSRSYGLEEVSTEGAIVSTTDLTGKPLPPNAHAVHIPVYGRGIDAYTFWASSEKAIAYIAEHRGLRFARRVFGELWSTVIDKDEMAECFRVTIYNEY
jgi:hypothetical protein